ncbi:MAG: hypothetical protein WC971_03290 [Coriobacteriia bacterium]
MKAAAGGKRTGFRVALVLAGMSLAALLVGPATASAETIEISGVVFAEKCLPCHASIADSKSSEIIFKHAYHLLIACSSCHTAFPHRPEGTAVPRMPECWNCHNLRHGPQGLIAAGECKDCHRTPRERLRPSFHTWDWVKTPHVVPGERELRTKCMMCHDKAWCDDCHDRDGIIWRTTKEFTFDARNGCEVCHGNENLTRVSPTGLKSYQVTGVDASAHRSLTCGACHVDFKYNDNLDSTKVWSVNAALACQGCHDHEKVRRVYVESIHGQQLIEGNLKTATCSSCHGGHYIQRLDTAVGKAALHGSALRVCARCHKDKYDSYDDYYHGAAYKRGAPDAPACWDCHGAHDILPSSDASSKVSPEQVAATCRKCHRGSEESFGAKAGSLIHQKVQASEENPLARIVAAVKGWLPWSR